MAKAGSLLLHAPALFFLVTHCGSLGEENVEIRAALDTRGRLHWNKTVFEKVGTGCEHLSLSIDPKYTGPFCSTVDGVSVSYGGQEAVIKLPTRLLEGQRHFVSCRDVFNREDWIGHIALFCQRSVLISETQCGCSRQPFELSPQYSPCIQLSRLVTRLPHIVRPDRTLREGEAEVHQCSELGFAQNEANSFFFPLYRWQSFY